MAARNALSRLINTALLVVVGLIGLDTLFRLLGANPGNGIVAFVSGVSGQLLKPFANMFGNQGFLLTALIAVLGYWLAAAVARAIVRAIIPRRGARAGGGA